MRIFTVLSTAVFWALATPVAHTADAAGSSRAAQSGLLKPGRTAGVQKAQQVHTGLALIGAGTMIAVVIVAASSSGGGGVLPAPNMQSVPTTTP